MTYPFEIWGLPVLLKKQLQEKQSHSFKNQLQQEMIYISFQLYIRSCTIDVFILLYKTIY